MITRFSIVTLVIFILSIFFVIQPVHIPIRLPWVGRRKIPITLSTAPIAAIAILWASQCLGATQIRDGIVGTDGVKPYNILILFFSLAYLAITLDITGILQSAAFWVSNKGGNNGRKLFFYFYIMLTLLSVLLGNDPVILSGTVFLVYYTTATKLEPLPWLMSEFAAANTASMVLFLGNPTNVVICEGFGINNVAFTAYTILPFLACSVTCFIALGFQFRSQKYVPKKLRNVGHLDPLSVLKDPVGAWIGSLLMGSCLITIIVVSFFHVDVWMITLPFAVAKFIFDIGWDHYRYTTGRIPKYHRPAKVKKDSEAPTPDNEEEEEEEDLEQQNQDEMLAQIRKALDTNAEKPSGDDVERQGTFESTGQTLSNRTNTEDTKKTTDLSASATTAVAPAAEPEKQMRLFVRPRRKLKQIKTRLSYHFPTFFTALPRLPFALVPFAFSQFILIEALDHQGWIDVFARWLVIASGRSIHPSIWLIGVLGVILCNLAGTNIGATILLTKVVRAAAGFSPETTRASGIALAVASNIGAVSFTFSASLAGLLWKTILEQKGIKDMTQLKFAIWNCLPILVMTGVGLGVVSAEMAVLY